MKIYVCDICDEEKDVFYTMKVKRIVVERDLKKGRSFAVFGKTKKRKMHICYGCLMELRKYAGGY